MHVEYKQLEMLEVLPNLEVVYLGGTIASKSRRNQQQFVNMEYSNLKFKVIIDDSEYTIKVPNPITRFLKNWREANNALPELQPLSTELDDKHGSSSKRRFNKFWPVIVAFLAVIVLWIRM